MSHFELGEHTSLVRSSRSYVQPLSLLWRINHTIPYLIGGVTFLIGSYQYLPWVNNYLLGGWMFTIGSVGFLYADLHEWWKNNRVGCAFDEEFRDDFEHQMGKNFDPPSSICGKFQRAENGLNFALSAFGSLLYLIGSILFIPSMDGTVLGTEIFIPGSAVIFISQTCKLYRAGCTFPTAGENRFEERYFEFKNLLADLPGVGVDLAAGLGGFAYMIGSYLFLPTVAVDNVAVLRAAVWFLAGGSLFTISGIFIVYRYFCTLNYAH